MSAAGSISLQSFGATGQPVGGTLPVDATGATPVAMVNVKGADVALVGSNVGGSASIDSRVKRYRRCGH